MTAENPRYSVRFEVWKDDEYYIISKHGGPTTQGESLVEALMMMADALRDEEDDAQTMMKRAADIFIMDEEAKSFIREQRQQ